MEQQENNNESFTLTLIETTKDNTGKSNTIHKDLHFKFKHYRKALDKYDELRKVYKSNNLVKRMICIETVLGTEGQYDDG